MAAIPTLLTLGSDATLEEVREQLAILQKTIKFALTSNLGSENAYEFGNWLVTDNSLVSDNGTVGFSTADTAADDIRIWAGNTSSTIAPFRVYESGSVYMSNLTLTGGSISWNLVNAPTPTDVGALPANSPKLTNLNNIGDYLGQLAEGQVVGLPGKMTKIGPNGIYSGVIGTDQLIAQGALIGDAIIQNLSADKITTGTLSATRISTVGLSAEKIYQVGSPNNYAVMGGTYGDMVLYYQSAPYFTIYNDLTAASLKYKTGVNAEKIRFTDTGSFPSGTWDFSLCTHNIIAKFG